MGVRDPSGLSDVALTLSQAALHVLALMDGTSTCEQIRHKFHDTFGQELAEATLRGMLDYLEQAHFLAGESFDAYYQGLYDEYRARPTRVFHAAADLGIVDDSGDLFDEMLAGVELPPLSGPVVGLVAPHLDYARGAPCYGKAYRTLHGRATPQRVVILGTNHFGRSTSVVATTSDFETPLGVTRNDTEFLKRLEFRCGDLRPFEFDHAREHSIELQVAWLQHIFGPRTFSIVPLLCPDPCGPTGTLPYDGHGVDLREFAVALGELVKLDAADTLIVAGADLSHVGGAFGDERLLDEAFLHEVHQRDHKTLASYAAHDPEGFLACAAEDDNPTRVCSFGCMFVLATAMDGAKPTLLGYHQAVDQPSQTCVTCAAVAFT